MVMFKRVMKLAGIAVLGLALAACSRNITREEQVVRGPTFPVDAIQQWEYSGHATARTIANRSFDCKGCHTSEGFVARAMGTTPPAVIENPTPIHCFTCHETASSGEFSLRWPAVATLMDGASYDLKDGNLCVACHRELSDHRSYITERTVMNSSWGPHHGPQGDMLIGSNGYEYAGYTYEQSNHRSVTAEGCVGCHMKTTGQNVIGGHSLNMVWSGDGSEVLNTAACENENCHGVIGDFNEVGLGTPYAQDSVDVLIADLGARLVAARLMAFGVPRSMTTSADSAGAVWNFMLVKRDRSHGVHNPKYIVGLLRSAIEYLRGPLPGLTATHAQRAISGAKGSR